MSAGAKAAGDTVVKFTFTTACNYKSKTIYKSVIIFKQGHNTFIILYYTLCYQLSFSISVICHSFYRLSFK